MAPSSLHQRTPRYGDFINGVLLVVTASSENFRTDKIIQIYTELVERSDVLEIQVNNYKTPNKDTYYPLSKLISDYVEYHKGRTPAEWIRHSGVTERERDDNGAAV